MLLPNLEFYRRSDIIRYEPDDTAGQEFMHHERRDASPRFLMMQKFWRQDTPGGRSCQRIAVIADGIAAYPQIFNVFGVHQLQELFEVGR